MAVPLFNRNIEEYVAVSLLKFPYQTFPFINNLERDDKTDNIEQRIVRIRKRRKQLWREYEITKRDSFRFAAEQAEQLVINLEKQSSISGGTVFAFKSYARVVQTIQNLISAGRPDAVFAGANGENNSEFREEYRKLGSYKWRSKPSDISYQYQGRLQHFKSSCEILGILAEERERVNDEYEYINKPLSGSKESAYYESTHWHLLRHYKIFDAGYCCKLCNKHDAVFNCHHRSYERNHQELLGDLTVLCQECHYAYHAHRNNNALPTVTFLTNSQIYPRRQE